MTIIAFAFLLFLIKPSPFDTLCDADNNFIFNMLNFINVRVKYQVVFFP